MNLEPIAKSRNRRREEADDGSVRVNPPPHIGGYARQDARAGERRFVAGPSR